MAQVSHSSSRVLFVRSCKRGGLSDHGCQKEAGITTDDLPKRSPDLNVLDYSLWHAINARMRVQDRSLCKKKESKAQYLARLRRTAMGLPQSVVTKAVQDMHRRVRLLARAKGGLFHES